MSKLAFIAGALSLAIAGPAIAEPGKHGKGHGKHGQHQVMGWGAGGCPPGLAKKNNGCLPPGIAKKRFNVGQRWAGNYGYQWQYNQVPDYWRNQYNLDPYNRYYYGDGYLYSVDPKTMLVESVIRALLR
jgi:hypothetical protein